MVKIQFLSVAVSFMLLSCQSYDFEAVTPLALSSGNIVETVVSRKLKPNVMFLVDQSKSMDDKIVPSCVGAGCATRISELKAAMNSFTTTSATVARFGLTLFPAVSNQCASPGNSTVPMPSPSNTDFNTDPTLRVKAGEINAAISAIVPLGGTPTAASLQFLSGVPGFSTTPICAMILSFF